MKCLYCDAAMHDVVDAEGEPITMNLSAPVAPDKAITALFHPVQVVKLKMNLCPECGFVVMTCDPGQIKPLPKKESGLKVLKGGKDE